MENRPLDTVFDEARSRGSFPIGGVILLGVAVLAIGAAIALPNLLRSHHGGSTNETAAIATLRNLASCQSQFQSSRKCDLDGDGIGEFGTLAEMTATDGVREDATGAFRKGAIAPSILSGALASVDANGIVTKSGYCFRILLPRKGGGGIHEGKAMGYRSYDSPSPPTRTEPDGPTAGTPFTGPVDIDGSELRWCAYAWPVSFHNSGNRVFFVDQDGDVWQMANPSGVYSNLQGGPAWDAAMPADGKAGWSTAPNAKELTGRDGNVWKVTN